MTFDLDIPRGARRVRVLHLYLGADVRVVVASLGRGRTHWRRTLPPGAVVRTDGIELLASLLRRGSYTRRQWRLMTEGVAAPQGGQNVC